MDGSQSPGSIHVTFGKTNCFLIEDEQDPGTWIEEELEAKKADFIDEILNGNLQNGKSSKILYIITMRRNLLNNVLHIWSGKNLLIFS